MRYFLYAMLLLLGLTFFYSCVPAVVFEEPQPQGAETHSSFPMMYRGTFLCSSDSAIVWITDKLVYKEKTYSVTMTQVEVNETEGVELIGDQLYIESINDPVKVVTQGDSVFANVTLRDTLFHLGKDQVLTQFRGHQLLNRQLKSGDWEVMILSINYDFDLILSKAVEPEDLEQLESITPVEDLSRGDTVQYRISPSVYEFNQILEEQLIFEPCDYYERVRLSIEI